MVGFLSILTRVLLKRGILMVLLLIPLAAVAQTAGQVMFVGFNADGNDGFAFVTLVPLPNGTTIYFTDDNWDGVSAFNSNEGAITWINDTGNTISAGTVIAINDINGTLTLIPDLGSATESDGGFDLNVSNETLYMFLGSDDNTPTTFLSAIANDNFGVAPGIGGTGLTSGVNAFEITVLSDEDVMIYDGPIVFSSVDAGGLLLTTQGNWSTDDSGGNDSNDGGYPDFPTHITSNFYGFFEGITYYSRNATSGGNWDDPNSWTTASDGSGGPLASGIWPSSADAVVILPGHTITINSITDNNGPGISPDGLGRSNVGSFTSSNTDMFYHIGDITISGILSVTGIEMMTEGYTHILAGGTFNLGSNLVNLGYLEADASSTFSCLDDLVLTGNSNTIINTNATSTDDLVMDHTDAQLCGTGIATLQNGAGSQITYTNSATVAQICSSFTVACTGIGCDVNFPVTGTGSTTGNTGPGGVGNSLNNELWVSADFQVYSDAGVTLAVNTDNIRQWNDRSGNNNHLGQTTAGQQPNYQTGILNGLPVARYTAGNNDNLLATGLSSSNNASVWVVASFSTLPSSNPGLIHGAPAGSAFSSTPAEKCLGMWVSTAGLPWGRGVQSNNTIINIPTGSALSSGAFTILMNQYGTASINQYINHSVSGSVAYDGTLRDWSDFGVGRQGNESWNGDIAEVIVYTKAVNNAERIIIDNYLAAKYDRTLGANDVYTMDNAGNGNFDFEVAGVGQASDGSRHTDARGSGAVRMVIQSNPSLSNDEFLIWGHNNGTMTSNYVDVDNIIIRERIERIWRVSETGDVGNVSLSFDISGFPGSPLAANLRVLIDRDGDGFADNDVTPISGATLVSGIATFSGINLQDGDRFTLGNTDLANPLPIELTNFIVEAIQGQVHVKWTTDSELNNDFFSVERSKNIADWEIVTNVTGAGTTTLRNHYGIIDDGPHRGVSYYRLKQTDFDGTFTYSPIRRVVIGESDPITVHPNPATREFTVTASFTIMPEYLKMYDGHGRSFPVRIVDRSTDQHEAVIDVTDIPKGFYVLQISDGFVVKSVKILKQ